MDNATRELLHDLVLKARPLLMGEARDLLEGAYGLDAGGRFAPADAVPALDSSEEARETRARLERYLADERAAGLTAPDAVAKLVKETAFTHLNRLVAFKMMESRRLVRGTLDRYQDSNAFKFYLADHPDEQALYDAGSLPQDALGEGPRDIAYRRFLLHECARMAEQIRVLFDPDTLPSRFFPRPPALAAMLTLLNDPALKDAWGEDETIGWVYQSFNSRELEQAFREARLSNKKFEPADIAAVTQLFTPRWIVRFLVQNTLGRLWLAMHPDSRLRETLDYLVPLAQEVQPEPLRPVREITLLDPACGTMHFGLVAFDLFAAMYQEEIERAGEPGWPQTPSVSDPAEIASAIIQNNLYGIDIDLRAVQLSALTLLLKARSLNREARLTDHNLACADVMLLNGARLSSFLEEAKLGPIYERLIRGLWGRLQDSNQLGSLLRLEADLQDLIAGERRKYEAEQEQPHLPGFPADQFDTEAGRQEFWTIIEAQIGQAFDAFARHRAEQGLDERYFTGEAVKGLRLLDLMRRRYDVVVTNPPYMSNRKMNNRLKSLVASAYPAGKRDLYAAFIERCMELATSDGRVGMLTMHSFMFITSYEALRQLIVSKTAIESQLHLGPALFDVGNPGTLQTAAFVLRRERDASCRIDSVGTYIRLVKELDAEAKQSRFERALAQLILGRSDPAVYHYRQGDFAAIRGAPWVYWITPGLCELFKVLPTLSQLAPPKHGLSTGDNFRFVRNWWEVGRLRIAFRCHSVQGANTSGGTWFPYLKGEGVRRWWGNQAFVINFVHGGANLRAAKDDGTAPGQRFDNPKSYFQRGITYGLVSSGRFSARLSPVGFIFDVGSPSVFPKDVATTLAVLNSQFTDYALRLINPTINVSVGDLARLPMPVTTSDTIHALVDQVIHHAQSDSQEAETTYVFIAPPSWQDGQQAQARRRSELAKAEREIDEEVYRLYSICAEDRAAIEAELAEPVMGDAGEETDAEAEAPFAEDEQETASGEEPDRSTLARRWVSYAAGVVLGRFSPGVEGALGRGTFAREEAKELRALSDANGLVVVETGYPDNLAARITRALEVMVGEDEAAEIVAVATGGKTLADYLRGEFFKAHVQQYRKRPVYWLLQSPKRRYSVYAFHERMTPDTLHLLRGAAYLGGAINGARSRQTDLHAALAATPQGPARKKLERELEAAEALLADLEAFDRNLAAVTAQRNERGETVGWRPEIDDGVLINLAPLSSLMPSWAAEPRKAWEALAKGEYDWAHTAMRYWPDRVIQRCRTNKSYAIAHGLQPADASSR